MSKRGSLLENQQEDADINISPMIDMVFILLIFFIVTTVFIEEPGVEINKPFAVAKKDLAKNSILLAVTSSNQIVYGGSEVGLSGVRSTVRRLLQKDETLPIIIQADEASSAGLVVRVVDEAKLGGAPVVHVSTEVN